MAAFKFYFRFQDASEEEQRELQEQAAVESAPTAAAVEVFPGGSELLAGSVQEVHLDYGTTILLRSVSSDSAANMFHNESLTHRDVLPGHYEGGLKLWESAVDLANFLLNHQRSKIQRQGSSERTESMSGMRVIELGCGHGMPGIICALAGAYVCFQDYNAEALTSLAAPNLQLNLRQQWQQQQQRPTPRYFSGDWSNLVPLLVSLGEANSFDIVISAETLYSKSSMQALYACIKQCLKPGGHAFVAAKTMYFGLDGGTLPFRELVQQQDPSVSVETVIQVNEGVCREVLKLSNIPVVSKTEDLQREF